MTNDERDSYIRNTHDAVIALKEWAKNHADNGVIHQVPPCDHYRTLCARLWGLAAAVIVSVCASVLALLRGH